MMFPRTKHFRTCSYSRDKFLCLNDVNNDTRVHFIATFVAESVTNDLNNKKYNETFAEIHISFCSADAIF